MLEFLKVGIYFREVEYFVIGVGWFIVIDFIYYIIFW